MESKKKKTKSKLSKVVKKVTKSIKKGFENIGQPIAKSNGII
jgi:hypothetical protein